jgi:hypothetical protein
VESFVREMGIANSTEDLCITSHDEDWLFDFLAIPYVLALMRVNNAFDVISPLV